MYTPQKTDVSAREKTAADSLISVIVPVYNVEKYLRRCVDSIINQTYKNLEIILVDDGSPDNCGAICDEYANKDSRVKVIHKVNGGLSDARNAGLDICQGQYIGFVDSDDWIELDMYETLYNFMVKENLDVAMCCAQQIYDDGRIIKLKADFAPGIITDKNELISIIVNGGFEVVVWSKLFSKKVMRGSTFKKGKIHEDKYFVFSWLDKTERFGCLNVSKYYYFKHDGSITDFKHFKSEFVDLAEAAEYNYQVIKERYPKSIEIGVYGLLLSYIAVINRILDCVEVDEHIDLVNDMRHKIRRSFASFMSNKCITRKEKLKLLLISTNLPLYRLIRTLWKNAKKRLG